MTNPDYNPMKLENRRILVTGASSGIGRAAAVVLSRLGARVVCADRNTEGLRETSSLLSGEGHGLECYDLKDIEGIPAWLDAVCDAGGFLYGFVHAAGVRHIVPAKALKPGKWRSDFLVNVEAALSLTKAFLGPKVSAGGGGSIVFISSVLGMVGSPGETAYSAGKGALISMTKSLALELAPNGIRVNCVAPGSVKTPMHDDLQRFMSAEQRDRLEGLHPLGIGQPEDVAHAVAFLMADTARWVTGTTLVVDGGYTAR